MVGYFESDPMSSNQKLFAGVFSGIVTRFLTQPMDVLKVRTQLIKKSTNPALTKMIKKIYFEEGVKAFFQGHAMGQVHSILAVSTQFYIYELATTYAASTDFGKHNKVIASFFCGMLSGFASTALVMPLEVIRVRQILVHEQYGGFLKGARNVYKSGGFKAFYEGLSASLIQMGPSVGLSFTTFRLVQNMILHALSPQTRSENNPHPTELHKPEHIMIASTVAGSVAGFVSKSVTYPFDLVKKRLQIASHITSDQYNVPDQVKKLVQCRSIVECFVKSYEKDGIKGWFRGWTVTIYKSQLTSIAAFTSYEMTCSIIRSFIVNK